MPSLLTRLRTRAISQTTATSDSSHSAATAHGPSTPTTLTPSTTTHSHSHSHSQSHSHSLPKPQFQPLLERKIHPDVNSLLEEYSSIQHTPPPHTPAPTRPPQARRIYRPNHERHSSEEIVPVPLRPRRPSLPTVPAVSLNDDELAAVAPARPPSAASTGGGRLLSRISSLASRGEWATTFGRGKQERAAGEQPSAWRARLRSKGRSGGRASAHGTPSTTPSTRTRSSDTVNKENADRGSAQHSPSASPSASVSASASASASATPSSRPRGTTTPGSHASRGARAFDSPGTFGRPSSSLDSHSQSHSPSHSHSHGHVPGAATPPPPLPPLDHPELASVLLARANPVTGSAGRGSGGGGGARTPELERAFELDEHGYILGGAAAALHAQSHAQSQTSAHAPRGDVHGQTYPPRAQPRPFALALAAQQGQGQGLGSRGEPLPVRARRNSTSPKIHLDTAARASASLLAEACTSPDTHPNTNDDQSKDADSDSTFGPFALARVIRPYRSLPKVQNIFTALSPPPSSASPKTPSPAPAPAAFPAPQDAGAKSPTSPASRFGEMVRARTRTRTQSAQSQGHGRRTSADYFAQQATAGTAVDGSTENRAKERGDEKGKEKNKEDAGEDWAARVSREMVRLSLGGDIALAFGGGGDEPISGAPEAQRARGRTGSRGSTAQGEPGAGNAGENKGAEPAARGRGDNVPRQRPARFSAPSLLSSSLSLPSSPHPRPQFPFPASPSAVPLFSSLSSLSPSPLEGAPFVQVSAASASARARRSDPSMSWSVGDEVGQEHEQGARRGDRDQENKMPSRENGGMASRSGSVRGAGAGAGGTRVLRSSMKGKGSTRSAQRSARASASFASSSKGPEQDAAGTRSSALFPSVAFSNSTLMPGEAAQYAADDADAGEPFRTPPRSRAQSATSIAKGKRKAEDVETTPPDLRGSQRATFAIPADPRITHRPSTVSRVPSSYHRKRARLSAPTTPSPSRAGSTTAQPTTTTTTTMGTWSSRTSSRTPIHSPSRAPSAREGSSPAHAATSSAAAAASGSTPHTPLEAAHDRRRSLSQISIPLSALVTPHAPSIAPSGTFHMRDPRRPRRRLETAWTLRLGRRGGGEDEGEGGSPAHAWLFFGGFVLFPLWWLAAVMGTPETRVVGGEDTEKAVTLDDPQIEFDAKSWRFRCRVMSVLSLFTYVPFIVLVAVFVPR